MAKMHNRVLGHKACVDGRFQFFLFIAMTVRGWTQQTQELMQPCEELSLPRLLPPPKHLSHLSALPELCPHLSQIEISLLLKKE